MKYKIFLLALQFFDVYFTDMDPEFFADPDPEKNQNRNTVLTTRKSQLSNHVTKKFLRTW